MPVFNVSFPILLCDLSILLFNQVVQPAFYSKQETSLNQPGVEPRCMTESASSKNILPQTMTKIYQFFPLLRECLKNNLLENSQESTSSGKIIFSTLLQEHIDCQGWRKTVGVHSGPKIL